jgi:sulfate permease, SulP family
MTNAKRPTAQRGGIGNLIGGFVAGLYSVPKGIGYASLAGINPMLGIYAGMVPVAVAAAFTGSVLLMSTLTSAIALTMDGILDEAGYAAAQVPQAVVTMALLAGLLMVVLGVLKLGVIVNYFSNAVMTGFVMGVAVLI